MPRWFAIWRTASWDNLLPPSARLLCVSFTKNPAGTHQCYSCALYTALFYPINNKKRANRHQRQSRFAVGKVFLHAKLIEWPQTEVHENRLKKVWCINLISFEKINHLFSFAYLLMLTNVLTQPPTPHPPTHTSAGFCHLQCSLLEKHHQ